MVTLECMVVEVHFLVNKMASGLYGNSQRGETARNNLSKPPLPACYIPSFPAKPDMANCAKRAARGLVRSTILVTLQNKGLSDSRSSHILGTKGIGADQIPVLVRHKSVYQFVNSHVSTQTSLLQLLYMHLGRCTFILTQDKECIVI
jgi:hypothetical protein